MATDINNNSNHFKAQAEFRAFLLNELSSRCHKNPRYSLRAFAKFLNIDPGTLSKILNNKHTPGVRLIERLSRKLSISPLEIEKFKVPIFKLSQIKKSKNSDFLKLKTDEFNYISKWYFMAILELLEVKDFRNNYQWMADRLGISLYEVQNAFSVLERIGMIKQQDGEWIDLSNGKSTCLEHAETSGAMRSFQKEILSKAIDALEDVPIEDRSQTSMTIAINKSELPLVKNLLAEFRRSLSAYLAKNPEKDEVYHLGLSFYPVTKKI